MKECSNENTLLEGKDIWDISIPSGYGRTKLWTCTRLCDQTKGNFIEFLKFKEDNREIINLIKVEATYCKPKPPDCHCKTLLESLLRLIPEVNKISLMFAASPFKAGCQCYLGAAARRGFDNVQFGSSKTMELLTTTNYANSCKKYEFHKLAYSSWEITKKDVEN